MVQSFCPLGQYGIDRGIGDYFFHSLPIEIRSVAVLRFGTQPPKDFSRAEHQMTRRSVCAHDQSWLVRVPVDGHSSVENCEANRKLNFRVADDTPRMCRTDPVFCQAFLSSIIVR